MVNLQVLEEEFTICKVENKEAIPWDDPFLFTGKTDTEFSLVCRTSSTPPSLEREDGWRGFRITGQLDFSLVGILAPIATVLAENKIGIFAVSTYDTDYILVKEENLDRARCALEGAGYRFISE